jgi:hypothetical protein
MTVYEQPSRGRRIGPALVFVLVLLAGAAGGSSYYVTRQVLAGSSTPLANGPTGPTGAGTPAASDPVTPSQTQSAPPTTTAGTRPTATPSPTADPGRSCPALTEQAVRAAGQTGGLKLLLYVAADGIGGQAAAEAWICQNTAGVLFYQGHRRTGPFTAATSNDTILVGTGIRGSVVKSPTEYVATNPKDPTIPDDPNHTDYHASATSFFYLDLPENLKVTYKITRTVIP